MISRSRYVFWTVLYFSRSRMNVACSTKQSHYRVLHAQRCSALSPTPAETTAVEDRNLCFHHSASVQALRLQFIWFHFLPFTSVPLLSYFHFRFIDAYHCIFHWYTWCVTVSPRVFLFPNLNRILNMLCSQGRLRSWSPWSLTLNYYNQLILESGWTFKIWKSSLEVNVTFTFVCWPPESWEIWVKSRFKMKPSCCCRHQPLAKVADCYSSLTILMLLQLFLSVPCRLVL